MSNVATGAVVVVDTGTFRISETLSLGGFPSDITVHPDGERVFVPNVPVDGSLSVVDVATREVVESFVVEEFGALGGSALSADGSTLYISEFALGNVFVIDVASYTVREFISVGGGSGLEGLDVVDLPQGCRPEGCPGDCDADGEVRIAELVLAVNIALNRSDSRQCLNADIDGDGAVSISELVRMVNSALGGCSSERPGARVSNDGRTRLNGERTAS